MSGRWVESEKNDRSKKSRERRPSLSVYVWTYDHTCKHIHHIQTHVPLQYLLHQFLFVNQPILSTKCYDKNTGVIECPASHYHHQRRCGREGHWEESKWICRYWLQWVKWKGYDTFCVPNTCKQGMKEMNRWHPLQLLHFCSPYLPFCCVIEWLSKLGVNQLNAFLSFTNGETASETKKIVVVQSFHFHSLLHLIY